MTLIHLNNDSRLFRVLVAGDVIMDGDICCTNRGNHREAHCFSKCVGMPVGIRWEGIYIREVDPLLAAMVEVKERRKANCKS